MKTVIKRFVPLFGVILFAIVLWVLHHQLNAYRYSDILKSLQALSGSRVLLAFALTVLNYLLMTGYDTLAFHYIAHPLRYGKIALASFVGYAFSNNVGLSMISGGYLRYRLYSSWGLSAVEIARVIAFYMLTFWLGLLTMSGLVLLFEPVAIPASLHLPFSSAAWVGAFFLLLVSIYLSGCWMIKRPAQIRGWHFSFPSGPLSLFQIGLSSLDWSLAGGILYLLLPPSFDLSYPNFLAIFLLAQIAGLVSQIPGGLGIFETVILGLSPSAVPASAVLGSLVLFRIIYYFFPLVIATVLLGAYELLRQKERVRWVGRVFGESVTNLAPSLLALSTFVSGALLLFSGATPAASGRLGWLSQFLPLPVMELSHFLGSLLGMALLLLSRGLQQRLDAAYFLSAVLLGVGVASSLLKGFDYEEAIILSIMLGALFSSRRHFHRKASLLTLPYTPGWVAAILFVLLGSLWMGAFSYKHVEYSNELWWHFTISEDAPRFLRAAVGAISAALFFAGAKLLRAAPSGFRPPSAEDLEKARAVIERSPRALTRLALLGDKALLFNKSGTAFMMYGIEGRSWIALGDPVGPKEEMGDLTWQFHQMCELQGAWTVFYQVQQRYLSLYVDLGLTLLKIGEEATVPLTSFSLEGSEHRGLRRDYHRCEREGYMFEVIRPGARALLQRELKEISDVWLAEKRTAEKKFSLGFFNVEYLEQFQIGVARKGGKIVAFANILPSGGREELSIDLMRYLPEAHHGVMDYLLIQVMLWGKEEGYLRFNLGMAPLSGLDSRPLISLWNRLGAFTFRHGERFYHFQGLREYKNKFHPLWEPRYLALPGGLPIPRILADITSLIAGGLKGVVAK